MLITCWSAKGGSGTTVVAALLALERARESPEGVLALDLSGELNIALGVNPPEPGSTGIREWLGAEEVALDSLGLLAVEPLPGLRLIGPGEAPVDPHGPGASRAELLADQLVLAPRVIVDAGTLPCGPAQDPLVNLARTLAAGSTHSLLVTRACYLSLRRAVAAPLRPSGVVLIREPGRALQPHDVAAAIGAPVVLEIAWDAAIARAVDSGLLHTRLPRRLDRSLRAVAA